jgi:2,3-dihydroxybenzoate-AMP ligase
MMILLKCCVHSLAFPNSWGIGNWKKEVQRFMQRHTHKEIIDGWHPFTDEEITTYVAKGLWHDLTVCDLLDRNAALFPNKPALVDGTREITWMELQAKANRIALHLHRLGVGYADFFVLQMANVVEFFYLFFGLNLIGAIPVMGLPRHRMLEVNHEIGLHKAKGICVMAGEKFDFVGMVEEIKNQHPYLEVLVVVGGTAPGGWQNVDDLMQQEIEGDYPAGYLAQYRPDPNDICCEQLSGGTTGLPKGIPRTHNDYICQWKGYGALAGYTEESVSLVAIPVAHNAAFITVSGPTTFMGGTIVVARSPRPEQHFELIERYGVTHAMLIPVQITYWMEANDERKNYDLSSLRVIGAGGQKVKPELVEWCLTELGVDMVNHLGMAEGPMICNRWNSPKEPQMNTIGFPMFLEPEVEIRIVDDKNEEVGIEEVGEMVAKGALNFRGYFRNPEENKKSFDKGGFFHSGDLMSWRQDGRLVVEGRKKDMIIRGGENVYPEPVENLLVKHPKIINAAVVGMPDPRLGERLCAFVQPRQAESVTLDEVKQYMAEEGIAVFQWPERLEIVGGWPLTAVNKIDKRNLRAYIAAQLLKEGEIDKEFGNEFLKRDKLTLEDVLSEKVKIEFIGTPL